MSEEKSLEQELRKFIVSEINFSDLDDKSRDRMFKGLVQAYCQFSSIFTTRVDNIERLAHILRQSLLAYLRAVQLSQDMGMSISELDTFLDRLIGDLRGEARPTDVEIQTVLDSIKKYRAVWNECETLEEEIAVWNAFAKEYENKLKGLDTDGRG